MSDLHIQLTQDTAQEAKALAAQEAAKENASPRWGTSERQIGGLTRTTWSGGESTTDTNAGVVKDGGTPSAPSGNPGQAITARSAMGSTLTGRAITPTSIVNINGIETSVQAALHANLIHDTGNGYAYGDGTGNSPAPTPQQQQQQQKAPQQEQPTEDRVANLDPVTHALVTETVAKTGGSELAAAMTEIITKGELSEDVVNSIAQQRGVAPEQIRTQTAAIRTAYETQARTMAGPIADPAFSWAYQNNPQLMTDAIKAHVQGERADAYQPVVNAYLMSLSPEDILGANNASEMRARRESDGSVTIQTSTMPTRMSFKAAVKSGFIGRSTARR
jgi:hypothetical protein